MPDGSAGVSLLLDLGVPPHIVGHSDVEVTMTVYAHAVLDEKRKTLRSRGTLSAEAVAVTVVVEKTPGAMHSGVFHLVREVGSGGVEPLSA